MKLNAVAAAFSLGLTIAVGPGADATASDHRSPRETRLAQVRPEAGDTTADNLRGIGLTASHKRIIFDHIESEQAQTVPNNAELSVGSTIPDSLIPVKGLQVCQSCGRQNPASGPGHPKNRGYRY